MISWDFKICTYSARSRLMSYHTWLFWATVIRVKTIRDDLGGRFLRRHTPIRQVNQVHGGFAPAQASASKTFVSPLPQLEIRPPNVSTRHLRQKIFLFYRTHYISIDMQFLCDTITGHNEVRSTCTFLSVTQ